MRGVSARLDESGSWFVAASGDPSQLVVGFLDLRGTRPLQVGECDPPKKAAPGQLAPLVAATRKEWSGTAASLRFVCG